MGVLLSVFITIKRKRCGKVVVPQKSAYFNNELG